ncbi:MAG: PEFG-CTERM sorting domain-containing protein [Nitrososphaerota archaeon]
MAGNATFSITPNPYAYTTNSTDYVDLTTWFSFVVSDDGKFDSDPMPGIIELIGVNNGTYSITQIKGTSGFGLSPYPEASDEVLGTAGFTYVTQTFVNFTTTTTTIIEPPNISDAVFDKLKNTGGAKINGITMSNANELPPAMFVNSAQKLTADPPDHIVFTQTFSSSATPSTLFNTLGIPTYSAPKDVTSNEGSSFMPPLFAAPVSGNGGNFIMTPLIDEIVPGSNIVMRFDEIDQGSDHPLLEAIDLPMNTQGSGVGISIHVHDEIPSGAPAIPSGFVGIYLDFETTGDVDFSDSSVYSEDPSITFTLPKVGSACPIGVTLYLEEGGHWHSVATSLSPTSTDAHTCTYSADVDHFSSYLVGTGNTDVGHDHDSSHDSSSHDSHDAASHHSHSNHAHKSLVHGEDLPGTHPHEHAIMEITKTLTIYEIQYSLETGFAQIIIGTTGPLDDIEIQMHGRNTGLITAKPAKINPFDDHNKQNQGMGKYVFEVPLDPNETYFRISIDDAQYTLTQTVAIDGIQGKVVPWYAMVSEMSDHSDRTTGEVTVNPAEYAIKFDGGIKAVSYNDMQFPIKYEMAGNIIGVEVNEETKAVNFLLDSVSGGELLLQVPRSLVDALDDNFVVLVSASPQSEINYDVIASTVDYYTLKVTLPEGADSLTIMGSSVVPEFGVFTVLVLIASIISIIVILKTQKRVLQYN